MARTNKSGSDESLAQVAKFSQKELYELSGFAHQKITRFKQRLRDQPAYEALLRGPSWRKAMGESSSDQKGASGTGENEWYTPEQFVELVRTALGGGIDVDPATTAVAQEIVKAKTFYTRQNNGLIQEWHGRVFLNPPYSQPLIAEFISKLCAERRAGRVTAAILLTHNYTDTAWFHEITALADAICFTRGRVKFYEIIAGVKKIAAPTQGQAFSYFGDDVFAFANAFSKIGFVMLPWRAAPEIFERWIENQEGMD